jgi:L-ascorbate metabolism protein UlaG (beta-lactamase superfamily)
LALRITWLGHATVLVELSGVRLLTDPVLRSRVMHLRRHGAAPASPGHIHAVLLSHLHYDHLDLPSLRRLGAIPSLLCPQGAGAFLADAGLPGAVELTPGDRVEVGAVQVEGTRAEHDGTRRPRGPLARPIGFVMRSGHSIYFAGDTDLFEGMAELSPVDVALLPVAGYSSKLGPGHLDARRAAEAAALVRARVVVPIHWGTFHPITEARGRWFTEPPERFAAYARELAPEVNVRVLSPGGSLAL